MSCHANNLGLILSIVKLKSMFQQLVNLKICTWILVHLTMGSTAICKNDFNHEFESESEITPCNKINKPVLVYRFTGNVMKSIKTLRT